MVNSSSNPNNLVGHEKKAEQLNLMCKAATEVINQLYGPIDAVNRFLNLALQSLEEGSQSRQFLIESKQGIRKTSVLLKKLNNYTKRIEKELLKISVDAENE